MPNARPHPRRSPLATALLALSVIVTSAVALISAQPASAAVAQLPFTVVNNSGRGDATYVYVIARNLSTGQQGYVDAGGTWRAFAFPASIPAGQPNPAAPDVSISGPGNGASKTITLPPNLSGGRAYVSFGAKLQFFLTTNGLVEPAPWVSTDPNHDILYDWAEFARVGNAIFINTTTVDMFSMPMSVSITASNGGQQTQGITAGRTNVLSAISALGGDWARLTYTRPSDGLPLRVLAPTHGIANGLFSGTYLDAYVNAVWSYYASHTMTVDTSLGTFTSTVSGTSMTFRNSSGTVIGTLGRPSTNEVFGCSGALQPGGQPNQAAILAVGARVCAALHRATLSTASRVMSDRQPTTDASQFYQQSASDLYAKVIHSVGLNGLAYGFSYDDVGGFAPVIDQPDPASGKLTLGSFGTTTTPAATTITGPGGKCVDISGDDTGVNGTPALLWDCQSTAADQHWTWSGTALTAIGRCLDVASGGTANGTLLQLWDCNGTGAQQWVAQSDGSIKNPQSGRCMDSPGGATANGTRLEIWDCNGTGAQKFQVTTGTSTGTCPTYSDTPDFGANVHIYDHSMSDAAIQSSLDSIFNATKDTQSAQFGTRRDAELFKPSTTPYAVGANIGFNTSILGLGQNPDDTRINGAVTVDAFNASDAGNATQNFWRSAENLSVNTLGGSNRWAVAQAAPYRRMHVIGGLNLFPASYGWASGGYIADSKVDGNTESASQQQWYTRDSTLGSWSGSNWNMVFSGVNGAPANNFNTAAAGPRYTTLATTPVSRDVPYLYLDSAGKYRVFLPSLRTNASGPSWAGGSTPGSSVPMSTFYVAKPSDSAATINTALANGCNVFFTPGVYHVNQTLHVTKANTVVLGIGYPTIIPDAGVNAMDVADVDGVRLKGLLFDAGTTNSDTLLKVGLAKTGVSHAGNPTTVQDVFFRIGGMVAGKATNSLVVNTNNTIIDHTWAWRADHGSGIGWTVNTADNGLTVNGDNVLATGLFVEHYQKNEVLWNGANGKILFFQNEMPYDPPNQAAWMNGTTQGYPAIKVASGVTTFEAWGLGSYCYFNVNPAVVSARAFDVPAVAGVKFHDMAVVSLGGVGTISHVINNTGAAANSANNNVYLVNFP